MRIEKNILIVSSIICIIFIFAIFFIFFVFHNYFLPIKSDNLILKITYAPTYTPSPTFLPTPTEIDEYPPGVFALGMQVIVKGTGGDGLRIRNQPGQQSDIMRLASEGSLWQIIEGPHLMDGYIWWHIKEKDSGISGWAVQDYLTVNE